MTPTAVADSPRWTDFWSRQSSARNSDHTSRRVDAYGAELRVLFGDAVPERVLELGCGDGALYDALGFAGAHRYLGVDISARMLEEMTTRHPEVETICGPGHTFEVDEPFDLIFSAATVQYFDRSMLAAHFGHAARMLAPGGRLVCASTPWRRMRWAYARGDVARRPRRPLPLALAAHLKRMVRDNMGFWHDIPEVREMAADAGLSVEFYGSLHYPYRFHFVLQHRTDR